MPDATPPDRRWPRWVYGVGDEPDARFSFANERTFLAWIRSSLALVAAGIGIYALTALRPDLRVEAHVAALILVISGVVSGVAAFARWARSERALRQQQPLPSSLIMPLLIIVLVVVGGIGMVLLW